MAHCRRGLTVQGRISAFHEGSGFALFKQRCCPRVEVLGCVLLHSNQHWHVLQVAKAAERLQWALKYAVWGQSAADKARTKLAAEHLLRQLQQRYASCSWHTGVAACTCRLQPRLTAGAACSSAQAAAEVCHVLYSTPEHLVCQLQQRCASCSWHTSVAACTCRLQPRLTAGAACSSAQAAAEVCHGLYSTPDCRAQLLQSCLVG